MSDHENAAEQKTDLRIVVLAFAFPPVFIAVFAIAIVAYSGMFGAGKPKADEEAVAERILPVARVELARAIVFMANKSGASFKEPAEKK